MSREVAGKKKVDGLWKVPAGKLVLASVSPRRRDLLALQGLRFEVQPSDVDESDLGGPPRGVVRRLALAKARDIQRRRPRCWVIGADTVVTLDGENLGKPANRRQAREMLGRLSGREHTVFTGVALVGPGFRRTASQATRVRFRRLSRSEIRAYVATGEPMDKAGAYALQGQGAVLLRSMTGDWSNVIGMPLGLLRGLLAEGARSQGHRGGPGTGRRG
jgi:septum formation protein